MAATPQWSQFRGPNNSGVALEAQPPVKFGPAQNVLYKVPLSTGASSPCIYGERIYVTAFDQGQLWTIALDRATGKELWRKASPAEKLEDYNPFEGSPAASTPATDGEHIVSYFGSNGLFCYDTTGKLLWKFPLPPAEVLGRFGSGVSPIIADGKVILVRDVLQTPTIYALDVKTGKPVWDKSREGLITAYSTPVIWENNGVKEVVTAGIGRLVAYDLRDGSERWTVRELPSNVCTSPVVADGLLLFAGWSPGSPDDPTGAMPAFADILKGADKDSDGALSRAEAGASMFAKFFDNNDYDRDGLIEEPEYTQMIDFMKQGKNVALAIKPGGTGDITQSHVVWRQTKNLPYVPSPIYVNGLMFILKDGGIAHAVDAKTGEIKIKPERVGANGSYYASPVAAGNRIYLFNVDGVATVVELGEKFSKLHSVELGERVSATPAIVDNKLYVRTAGHLYAFGTDGL
ncbi:MAG: PQQ-binding-like beta-propeller repeat protein [Pirellulales bacterium]|nr:PQQ-binding-like beta-propeller repeat protein [Pirellulales bacterium]